MAYHPVNPEWRDWKGLWSRSQQQIADLKTQLETANADAERLAKALARYEVGDTWTIAQAEVIAQHEARIKENARQVSGRED